MRKLNDQILYSPSDLIRFLESPFASWMERARLEDPKKYEPDEDSAEKKLVQKKGFTHEAAFLDKLKKEGHEVATIEGKDRKVCNESTREVMNEQVEVIFQAYLEDGCFGGFADFLIRNKDGVYEPWDTKLSRQMKPYFLIQLCCYSELLEYTIGDRPERVHVVLGNGEVKSFSVSEYFDYYRTLKKRFLASMEDFDLATPPQPEPGQDHGRWSSHAEEILLAKRSLALVADIRTSQIRKLESAGICTIEDLAEAVSKPAELVKMKDQVFHRLTRQARLQLESEKTGGIPAWELIGEQEQETHKGLCELPPADSHDVFFDLEGYPLVDDGLEYLFGASYFKAGKLSFKDWWAHDPKQEKAAFENCVDWLHGRWRKNPGMHIYHYAPYEVSALKRLMCRYGTRENEVDDLLRKGVFIDLYRIIRHGLRVGTPSYSIKYIEELYRPKRDGEVSTSMGSVVEYARWIESGEPEDWKKSPILKSIRDYNKDDCDSTADLATWLRERQQEAGIPQLSVGQKEKKEEIDAEKQAKSDQAEQESTLIQEQLTLRSLATDDTEHRMYRTAADLFDFYRRNSKPIFWQMFERDAMTAEEQWEDPCCIEGVELEDPEGEPEKRSLLFTYRFDPDQECKIQAGRNVKFSGYLETDLSVHDIDREEGVLRLKISKTKINNQYPEGIPSSGTLILNEYVNPGAKRDSLQDTIKLLASGQKAPPVIEALLKRKSPAALAKTAKKDDPLEVARKTLKSMNGEVLCIQGPPGTGKTYTGARMASDVIDRGGRVGITALSHDAIINFLVELAKQRDGNLHGVKFGIKGRDNPGLRDYLDLEFRASTTNYEIPEDPGLVFAGTGWAFARPEWKDQLDVLFIDEAGQLPLADVVAVSRSARNIVLLGDQRQLEQPSQAVHPGRSGWSALEYLLDGRPTIARGEGVFLAKTRRLRPEVCAVVSDLFYEGRLQSHESAKKFRLEIPNGITDLNQSAGIHLIPILHEGNTQSSEEEVDQIERLMDQLVGNTQVIHHGRPLAPDDILIMAPYNMQVRKLEDRLPGFRVGTVDRFQGQEAEVILFSMCSSAGEYGTRGLDFLLNPRRLNVALSRARCIAFVIGDPRIAETVPTSVSLMRQLSAFARITAG